LTVGERIQQPFPCSRDLCIQPISLEHQLGNATLWVNVRSLGEPNQPIDDDCEPAFSGGRARLQQGRHVADRIARSSGQFVFLLRSTRGKSALKKPVTQPFRDIGLGGLGQPQSLTFLMTLKRVQHHDFAQRNTRGARGVQGFEKERQVPAREIPPVIRTAWIQAPTRSSICTNGTLMTTSSPIGALYVGTKARGSIVSPHSSRNARRYSTSAAGSANLSHDTSSIEASVLRESTPRRR